jgi:homogentisate 1,2-dioxygenase
VLVALARTSGSIAALRRQAPAVPIFLMGFSQGSCLALEHAARAGAGLAGVVAPSGARIGRPGEWAPAGAALEGLTVLLGGSAEDPYVAQDDLTATQAWFERAGARVERLGAAGKAHEITLTERVRAREILLGRPAPEPLAGFGNAHASEALVGALPRAQNSPRRPAFGLWAEQLSGTGFVAERHHNRRTWLYRVRPSAERRALRALPHPTLTNDFSGPVLAALAGFAPRHIPDGADAATDFVDGLATLGGAGSPALRRGYAVHLYVANRNMEHRAFYDADGDWLLIPQEGALDLATELGRLRVAPGEIAIVPRGVAVSVGLPDGPARGYVAEVFGPGFALPDRGPVGANGLTDARHFRAPAAWYEDRLDPGFRVTAKLGGALHEATQDHSPFDVVAWHGNHAPYVYDLADFAPMGSTRVDHQDPSIHTVLSAPLDERGAHALDLVVFVPRWDPTEGTFRPPYFHRNVTTEINGVIRDPDEVGGPFAPGCCFLTPSMTPHGVRAAGAEQARSGGDAPQRLASDALWFQLESTLPISLTPWAERAQEPSWHGIWGSHRRHFDPTHR